MADRPVACPVVADADLVSLLRGMVLDEVRKCVSAEVTRVVNEEAETQKQLERELRRGFFVEDSRLSPKELAEYVSAPVKMHLRSVPGLGEMSARLLNLAGVTTTFQLFAKFLDLRTPRDTWDAHRSKFWHFLEQHGISPSHRSTIVHAVSEKAALWMPALNDVKDTTVEAAGRHFAAVAAERKKKKMQQRRVVVVVDDAGEPHNMAGESAQ